LCAARASFCAAITTFLARLVNRLNPGYEQHWDQLFAASIIAIIPVVILFAFIEKHLVGGLTAGSIK
jgi:ABC-type glycerol-3-phosphate transport system permease component